MKKKISCYLFSEHQYAFNYWYKSGIKEATLLHFDTHADMNGFFCKSLSIYQKEIMANKQYRNIKDISKDLDVANFIVFAAYLGVIKDIYWIIPSWAYRGSKYEKFYWGYLQDIKDEALPQNYLQKKALEKSNIDINKDDIEIIENNNKKLLYGPKSKLEFLIESSNNYLYFSPVLSEKESSSKNSKKITIHKVYQEELPQNLDNTILDIDLDYFSCTGFDTFSLGLPDFSQKELEDMIYKWSDNINQKQIWPSIITVATSPNYTPTKYLETLPEIIVNNLKKNQFKIRLKQGETSYNLHILTLVANLEIKLDYIKINDPRSQKDINEKEVYSFLNSYKELHQYEIPEICYKQDKFDVFIKKPFKSIDLQNKDFSNYLLLTEEYNLLELKKCLEAFLICFLNVNSKWTKILHNINNLKKIVNNIQNQATKFDKQLFLLIEIDKQRQQIKYKNKSSYQKLQQMFNQLENELGIS